MAFLCDCIGQSKTGAGRADAQLDIGNQYGMAFAAAMLAGA
jgi:hypothetical protein